MLIIVNNDNLEVTLSLLRWNILKIKIKGDSII